MLYGRLDTLQFLQGGRRIFGIGIMPGMNLDSGSASTRRRVHLGEIGILGALLLLILINVAGAMPATPGNIGVFQLATVIPLTVNYHIPKTTAIAFSVGLQIIEGSIGLGVGSVCLLREGLKFDQVRTGARELEEEVEDELEEELEVEWEKETGLAHDSDADADDMTRGPGTRC